MPAAVLKDIPRKQHQLPDWLQIVLDSREVTLETVRKILYENSLNQKRKHDLKHDIKVEFRPGEQCLLKKGSVMEGSHPKAEFKTDGPYTISRRIGKDHYQLVDRESRRFYDVVSVDRMVPWPSRSTYTEEEKRNLAAHGEGWWPVKRVANCRITTKANRSLGYAEGVP